jgi:hypothetical protein
MREPIGHFERNEPVDTSSPETLKSVEETKLHLTAEYSEIPADQRNWRNDAAFRLLSAAEQHDQLVAEALRDAKALSETLRHAVKDPKRRQLLRDLLAEIEFELQAEQ